MRLFRIISIINGFLNEVGYLMKGLLLFCAVLTLTAHSSIANEELDVFSDKAVKQMYFRYAEGSLRNQSADKWIKRWSRFDGVVLKAFGEEGAKFGERELSTLRQFKKEFPKKALLLHFNGRARDPDFRQIVSSPQDYLYFAGTSNVTAISATQQQSVIEVADPSVFARKRTLPEGVYDDVVIVRRDSKKGIDWGYFEHAKLLSVDIKQRQIVIQRDLLGNGQVALEKGQAYIARHAAKGPFSQSTKQRLWEYNWFAAGQNTSNKTRLQETLSDFLVAKLSGQAEFFDGVSIDVLTESRIARVGGYPTGLDLDQDGNADKKSSQFDIQHAKAIYEFLQLLREKLPKNKLIIADGSYASQRAVHLLNGIESEGWPNFRDPELSQWSAGLNRHQYWNKFGIKPQLSYFKLAHYLTPKNKKILPSDNVRRLTVAAALLTDSIVVPALRPNGVPFHKWPEFRKLKNLGKALGPAQPLRLSSKQTLLSAGMSKKILAKKINTDSEFEIRSDHIYLPHVTETKPFCIQANIDAPEFTVSLTAKTTPDKLLPINRPAVLSVKAGRSSQKLKGYIGNTFFQSEYYFYKGEGRQICLRRETPGDLMLTNIDVYTGPYVLIREYENGLLISNPAHQSVRYDQDPDLLEFKDVSYREKVKNVLIPARDFLIVR
jgi:hypothetical protein